MTAPTEEGVTQFDEKVGDSLIQFKRLSERQPGESWILLYYGPSGSGKTYFGGTAGPRTLFINIGSGLETLLSPAFRNKYPSSKDMLVVDVGEKMNSKGFVDVATAFDMVTDTIDVAMLKHSDKFDTVVLDDATALRRFALNKGLELNSAARKGAARGKSTEEFVVVDIADYGREMQIIEWFLATYVQRFKAAEKHFVMVAHERQVYGKAARIGEEGPLRKILPGFTGKTFPDQVPAYFDDVWHAEVVGGGSNVVYRARTAGDEIETGKARHGGIFQTVERDPDFLKMLERIKNSHTTKR